MVLMHWKNAADPELRRLAEYNVLLCYRDEDPYDDRCDALNLCFGSTGVEIRLGVFDNEARTAYMHGVCILMDASKETPAFRRVRNCF